MSIVIIHKSNVFYTARHRRNKLFFLKAACIGLQKIKWRDMVLVLVILFLTVIITWTKKYSWYKVILAIFMYGLVVLIVILLVIVRNDNGYVQRQIDLVIEQNCELEKLKNITNDDTIEKYLQDKIDYNNKEIEKCIELQKRVPFYKWLIYFKFEY